MSEYASLNRLQRAVSKQLFEKVVALLAQGLTLDEIRFIGMYWDETDIWEAAARARERKENE